MPDARRWRHEGRDRNPGARRRRPEAVRGRSRHAARRAITAADAMAIAATDATKSLGLAWYIAYAKPARRLRVACRVTKAGAIVATLDDPAAANAWPPELEPVLAAMIAARP